jgi:hypothetical protein
MRSARAVFGPLLLSITNILRDCIRRLPRRAWGGPIQGLRMSASSQPKAADVRAAASRQLSEVHRHRRGLPNPEAGYRGAARLRTALETENIHLDHRSNVEFSALPARCRRREHTIAPSLPSPQKRGRVGRGRRGRHSDRKQRALPLTVYPASGAGRFTPKFHSAQCRGDT